MISLLRSSGVAALLAIAVAASAQAEAPKDPTELQCPENGRISGVARSWLGSPRFTHSRRQLPFAGRIFAEAGAAPQDQQLYLISGNEKRGSMIRLPEAGGEQTAGDIEFSIPGAGVPLTVISVNGKSLLLLLTADDELLSIELPTAKIRQRIYLPGKINPERVIAQDFSGEGGVGVLIQFADRRRNAFLFADKSGELELRMIDLRTYELCRPSAEGGSCISPYGIHVVYYLPLDQVDLMIRNPVYQGMKLWLPEMDRSSSSAMRNSAAFFQEVSQLYRIGGQLFGDDGQALLFIDPKSAMLYGSSTGRAKIARPTEMLDLPAGLVPHWFVTADFTGDGRIDAMLSGTSGKTWLLGVYYEQSYEPWDVDPGLPPAQSLETVFAFDYDRDGDADLLAQGGNMSSIEVAQTSITVPAAQLRVSDGSNETITDHAGAFTLGCTPGSGIDPVQLKFLPADSPAGKIRNVTRNGDWFGFTVDLRQPADEPRPCLGFVPGRRSPWGRVASGNFCPSGYAVVGNDDPTGGDAASGNKFVQFDCCPVAQADLLTGEHLLAENDCPAGYVVTGAYDESKDFLLRCTKVNPLRYEVAAPRAGQYWGTGRTLSGEKNWVGRNFLPPILRWGIGRKSFRSWDVDGCVGKPPGSLLVGRGAGFCSTWKYAEILDRKDKKVVELFPRCDEISSLYRQSARCRTEQRKTTDSSK